jgi:hypothetical protein
MARQNPIVPEIAKVNAQWVAKARDLEQRIKFYLSKGKSIDYAVNKAIVDIDFKGTITSEMLSGVKNVINKSGAVLSADVLVVEKYLLSKHWSLDSTSLSTKISSMSGAKIIKREFKAALQKNNSWVSASERLVSVDRIMGDPTSKLSQLVQLSKSALAGDVEAKRLYMKEIKKTAAYVEQLAKNDAPNTALKNAYRDVIELTKKTSAKAMEKALTQAVQEKARYNAERIARTELAVAYGQAQQSVFESDPYLDGVQWELSSRHRVYDICDIHAEADLWGGGKGIYPKNHIPQFPAHPHCLCILSPVYLDAPLKKNIDKKEKTKIEKIKKEDKISGSLHDQKKGGIHKVIKSGKTL